MSVPNLGSTWSEAVESAYVFGYDQYSDEYAWSDLKETIRRWADNVDEDHALSLAHNDADFDAAVHDSRASRELWHAIDGFFAGEMPPEVAQQYRREAAVAEDLDVAYEAGVYDALLGNEMDRSTVEHLKDHEPEV